MADTPEQLRGALIRLRAVTGIIADTLDLDPSECVVTVSVELGEPVARVSLADCFAETDRLLNADG